MTLLAEGDPAQILDALRSAAKPSQERLELRDVFVQGRRYLIEPRNKGFSMFTTSKAYWRYTEGLIRIRRRTRASARLIAKLTPIAERYTRIELTSHIRLGYLLDVLWIPLFFTSIIVFLPWHPAVIGGFIGALFALSYAYHYFNTAAQASEMLFFIHKALQERLVNQLPTLGAQTEPPPISADFQTEWERFYKRHTPTE